MIATARAGGEWMPRPIAVVAIVAAAAGLTVHAAVGFQGAYLGHSGAVWLSLARDLADGTFYRDLISEDGYGGTRYFPLFFGVISLFLKLGVPIVTAGWLAGSLSLAFLAAGVFRAVRSAGAPAMTAAVFAAGAAASYFAQQTVFEIRADVLAAAFNVWGIALVLPLWLSAASSGKARIGPAALCFGLAFATKITALSIPGALIAICLLTGRRNVALRLGAMLGAAVVILFLIVQLGSSGRALRVWAACMFGGSDSAETLGALFSASFLTSLQYSYLLFAVCAVSTAALVAGLLWAPDRDDSKPRSSWLVPSGLWIGASATVAVVLSSPGTIAVNQVAEWVACSLIVVAIVAGDRRGLRQSLSLTVAALVIGMAAQDMLRASEQRGLLTDEHRGQQVRLIDRLRASPPPVLSESALWPILGGREVVVPDPFAARVVFGTHPEIERDLVAKIEQREFSIVILEMDPASPRGRAIYESSHLGRTVMAAITARYRLEEQTLTNAFVFVAR